MQQCRGDQYSAEDEIQPKIKLEMYSENTVKFVSLPVDKRYSTLAHLLATKPKYQEVSGSIQMERANAYIRLIKPHIKKKTKSMSSAQCMYTLSDVPDSSSSVGSSNSFIYDTYEVEKDEVEVTPGTSAIKDEMSPLTSRSFCSRAHSESESLRASNQGKQTFNLEKNDSCNRVEGRSQAFSAIKLAQLAQDREHHCPECKRMFFTKVNLKKHIVSHLDLAKHRCNICGRTFDLRTNLQTHMLIHNRTEVSVSNSNEPDGRKRTRHSAKVYCCRICSMSFDRSEKLQNHIVIHRRDNIPSEALTNLVSFSGRQTGWFFCPICFKKFHLSGNLQAHMLTHKNTQGDRSEQKKQRGSAKSKTRRGTQNLRAHKLTHKNTQVNRREGRKRNNVKIKSSQGTHHRRMKKKNNKNKNLLHNLSVKVKFLKMEYNCYQCSRTYITAKALTTHLGICHFDKSLVCIHYVCSLCGKKFNKEENFLTHKISHIRIGISEEPYNEGVYKCAKCNEIFNNADFAAHKLSHMRVQIQLEEVTYICRLCGKKCPLWLDFVQYHLLTHKWHGKCKLPSSCRQCGKEFDT